MENRDVQKLAILLYDATARAHISWQQEIELRALVGDEYPDVAKLVSQGSQAKTMQYVISHLGVSDRYAESKFYLTRGFEDGHFQVAEQTAGLLVSTPWRVERESRGWVLSHADDANRTSEVLALGSYSSPELAVDALNNFIFGS